MAELPSLNRALMQSFQSQGLRAGNDTVLWALEQGFSGLCLTSSNFKMSDWHDVTRLKRGWLIKNGKNPIDASRLCSHARKSSSP